MRQKILLGTWNEDRIDNLLADARQIIGPGERIAFISAYFINTPYEESTLIGSVDTPEVFVLDIEGVDCFTFLDYVEAMRLSVSFTDFLDNLRRVRYCNGFVAFDHRNHFFTDWVEANKGSIEDVTDSVGGKTAKHVWKILNQKADGILFVPGIPSRLRMISYIPAGSLDKGVMENLRTGDYAGIYTETAGIDVSHVGIVIRTEGGFFLRHASSHPAQRRVIDEELTTYLIGKGGLLILRPVSRSEAADDVSTGGSGLMREAKTK